MKYLQCCFNWKVLVGLGVAALALWAAAPDVVGRALPVLIGLVCPLSMIVMMVGMGRMGRQQTRSSDAPFAVASRDERLADLQRQKQDIERQLSDVSTELKAKRGAAAAGQAR